jgi:hypothetical protein
MGKSICTQKSVWGVMQCRDSKSKWKDPAIRRRRDCAMYATEKHDAPLPQKSGWRCYALSLSLAKPSSSPTQQAMQVAISPMQETRASYRQRHSGTLLSDLTIVPSQPVVSATTRSGMLRQPSSIRRAAERGPPDVPLRDGPESVRRYPFAPVTPSRRPPTHVMRTGRRVNLLLILSALESRQGLLHISPCSPRSPSASRKPTARTIGSILTCHGTPFQPTPPPPPSHP